MNIFVCTFIPIVCPACAEPLELGRLSISDFHAGASFTCNCGARFQYVSEEKILSIAEDVKAYIR